MRHKTQFLAESCYIVMLHDNEPCGSVAAQGNTTDAQKAARLLLTDSSEQDRLGSRPYQSAVPEAYLLANGQ